VIHDLRERTIIHTRRGQIAVHDAVALRVRACECNSVVRRHFDELLEGVYPAAENRLAAD
ncbi:MAG TPA: hypothetical protein VE690_15155, partial [Rhodopila sp.]|nr:hypothetical protein [Rhodopila sp.]